MRLAVILAKHFNAATRACFPSIPTLAKVLALCERTIQRLLEALAKAGLIRVVKGGGRCASTYEMLVADGQALADAADISTPATTASKSSDAPPSSPSRPSGPSPRIWAGLDLPLWRKLAPVYRAATGRNPPLDARADGSSRRPQPNPSSNCRSPRSSATTDRALPARLYTGASVD